ncbi:MAG TPA: PAS domain S-box protein [Bryobacteraceae bacterium]|nr:PAS domain S-box protein [Bryobacteraceae bacterium]
MAEHLSRNSDRTRYLAALACTVCTVLPRLIGLPWLGSRYPYVLIYPAVMIAARFWGVGPGIFVLLTSEIATSAITGDRDWARIILLLVVGSVAIWIIEVLRRAHNAAAQSAQIAEQRLLQLREETAHRAHEESISAQLRAVVESSADAIVSRDLDGIILSWNLGAEQVFGYTAAEAVGNHISMLFPNERPPEEPEILERFRDGGVVKHIETVRRRKDGKEIPVSLTVSPVRNSSGTIVGASHIARDISERKALQEQLLQSQKLESLGVLAGGLAHDFNNLLTGIMGHASLAVQELGERNPATARMTEILHASERAATLVRQMLAYAGKGRFVIEPINLSAQVAEVLPLVRTSISRLVNLDVQLDSGLPVLEGDRSQIQQLIMNLVINAGEAIGDHPGAISIRTYSRNTDAEQQIVLEVKDSGSGMDAETQARAFDPFFTTKFTGRGLGLSAAVGIIRTHRGTISVESSPGEGSTFTVVLPASAQIGLDPNGDLRADWRGDGNILVVDDEEIVRGMARFTLERCGYTIEMAADGKAAVETFAARPQAFAAVLLDLTMPVMSGEEALDRIRQIRPDVPVLLSSGYSEGEALRRFRDRGLAGFLQKPYTATALARKVHHAVQLSSSR